MLTEQREEWLRAFLALPKGFRLAIRLAGYLLVVSRRISDAGEGHLYGLPKAV